MTLQEILSTCSLESLGREMGLEIRFVEGHLVCTPLDPDDPRYCMDFVMPTMKMVEACRADDFDFFQRWIDGGRLTVEQMHHAADCYHLGKTRSGQPIFWMIDDMLEPLDGHIAPDAWISTALKRREPLLRYWRPTHCLFGLHLLGLTDSTDLTDCDTHASAEKPVCVVESEASAVVLSELFPECIWMAYVSMAFVDVERFAPLQGHKVTIYPRTDPMFSNYSFFEDFADTLRRRHGLQVTVASVLEDHATDAQKERGIDILDFILDHEFS